MGLIKEEVILNAKEVDLKSFLESEGFTFVKESENHYRCKEEHTLVITYKFTNPIYFWYCKDQKGNIIDYVMQNITNNNFRLAIDYILKGGVSITSPTISYKQNALVETENKDISIMYSNDMKRTYGYLCKKRGVNPSIVRAFINKGLIREDQNHNVMFLHLNEKNKLVGADKTGTCSYNNVKFKGVVAGSNQKYGFSLKIGTELKKILVFEAPIDLISYYQMNESSLDKCLLLSTGGSSKMNVIETYLNIYKTIETILVCTDNDSAGDEAYESIKKLYSNYNIVDGRVELLNSMVNDFNDLLLKNN